MLEGVANIVLIGAGPRKAAMIERAERLKTKNVRFVASCPPAEMSRYLALASAAIVPLVKSNLMSGARPSKMFPALACGVPVLYCGEGEGARLIEDAGVGVVVEPQNPRAFAEAAIALLGDSERRALMSRRARALAVERFSWQAIVDEWLTSL